MTGWKTLIIWFVNVIFHVILIDFAIHHIVIPECRYEEYRDRDKYSEHASRRVVSLDQSEFFCQFQLEFDLTNQPKNLNQFCELGPIWNYFWQFEEFGLAKKYSLELGFPVGRIWKDSARYMNLNLLYDLPCSWFVPIQMSFFTVSRIWVKSKQI